MGLGDSIKNAIGLGDSGESEDEIPEEDWMQDVDSEVESVDDEMDPDAEVEMDTEPAEQEWESAYRFAEEFLEMHGFASMVDFTNKCMAYKVNQSPLYRDRISNGVETMNQVTRIQDEMSRIGGGGSSETDYEQYAKKLENANHVIDQVQKLSGKDEEMANEALALGHRAVNAIANNGIPGQGGGNVQSNVQNLDEEM